VLRCGTEEGGHGKLGCRDALMADEVDALVHLPQERLFLVLHQEWQMTLAVLVLAAVPHEVGINCQHCMR